ncbi:TylF/MycF family methyltransferase [Undibacterium sp. SXout7W]|uniref:TylF/MycF family methyltransferase n=1 Tax=Undibacterium sp. SXout7W TaxID=3413049 RepID=UPI003BF1152A
MSEKSQMLYLELLKKTLSFTLWPEPPIPVKAFNYLQPPLKRFWFSLLSRVLKLGQFQLVRDFHYKPAQRYEGQIWPSCADTMIGMKRLDNLQAAIETVIREGIEGDLIETGVWRGGACIFMRAVLAANDVQNRRIFVADSFQGLPEPDDKYALDQGDTHHQHRFLAVSRQDVENNFRRYGLLDDKVVFLQGWFKDTLPSAPIEKLSVLRLDGDMYESTMDALIHLYPKLSSGGFCIIDDYALPACRAAVNDFRAEHGITSTLHAIDWTGTFWRKD